jgi:mRNA-degrading endonuclease toxin of MazEF toxin-antitoxin module
MNGSVAIVNLVTAVSIQGRLVSNDDETISTTSGESWRLGRLSPSKMEEVERKLSRVFGVSE